MTSNTVPLPRVGQAVLQGTMSSQQAVRICLERIEKMEGQSCSFVSLDPQRALAEAQARDKETARGPLHGLPFAVKDIFDTADLPIEFKSEMYQGFQPAQDATAVELFRKAGAVFLGTVATQEFAGNGAGRKPRHAEFTPGGSTAGSGAAVGGGCVPIALATQTGGSTIRPASFCGAAAFKPTWGRVPVRGMKPFAPSLDTVGWIAEDCGLLVRAARACGIEDDEAADDQRRLRIGLYKTPYFSEAEAETIAALEKTIFLLEKAGHQVELVPGPDGAELLNNWQNTLMHGEAWAAYLAEQSEDSVLRHPGILDAASTAVGISHEDMREAYHQIATLRPVFDAAMKDFDAWLSPAVPGEPPKVEKGNRLASFNRLFTALHLPCVTLPGFSGPYGLPVGIQLLAPRFADSHLLRTAQVVEALINEYREEFPG